MLHFGNLVDFNTIIHKVFIGTDDDKISRLVISSLEDLDVEVYQISNPVNFEIESGVNLIIWDFNPELLDDGFSSMPVIFLNDEDLKTDIGFHYVLPKSDLNISFLKFAIKSILDFYYSQTNLQQLEYRNKIMAGNSTEIIWEWNLKTDLLVYNLEGWNKVLGYSSTIGQCTYDEWMDMTHPADNKRVRDFFASSIQDKSALRIDVEYRMQSSNGYVHLREVGVIYRDETGEAYLITGSSRDISDKKKSDEELRKLSHIVRETNNSVVLADVLGRIAWVNDAFVRTTGFTAEEVIGKKPGDLLQTPKSDPNVIKYMSESLQNKKGFECEILNQTKSGEEVWFWVQCQPQFNQDGEHEGFFAIQTNITADKRIAESIAANERVLRTLLENNNDGLSIVSPDGNKVSMFYGRNILGLDENKYGGDNYLNFIHPDDVDAVRTAFAKVKATPESTVKVEFRAKKSTGEYTWMESVFKNLTHVESIKGIVTNFRDINERKVSETLIRTSEIKYRNLFNNNPLALVIWDYDTYQILEVNDFAVREYGYTQEEFKKLKVTDLIVPENLPRFLKIVEQGKSESFRVSYKSENIKKNGEVINVIITFHPVDYYSSRANLAMVNNITEQVQLEKQLALEQNKKQQEITSAVINAQEQERQHLGRELHDNINQILATTRLYIEYAMQNDSIRKQLLMDAKNMVLTAVNEIRNLSNTLLPNAFETVGLIPSIDDVLNSLRKIKKFEIVQELDFDDVELPSSQQLTIFRIVQEQLNNIIKYAEARKVWVSIVRKDDKLKISIKDDGIGFDTTKINTSLGLKNIQSRAALHNGIMKVISAPGKGTELKVTFKMPS